MIKKFFLGVCFSSLIVLAFISGCTTSTSTGTTTTTGCEPIVTTTNGGETTTTETPTTTEMSTTTSLYSSSGTVNWTWEAGSYGTVYIQLYGIGGVVGSHINNLPTTEVAVSSSEAYIFSSLSNGTYIVYGYLFKNRWVATIEAVQIGDRFGLTYVIISDSDQTANITLEVVE